MFNWAKRAGCEQAGGQGPVSFHFSTRIDEDIRHIAVIPRHAEVIVEADVQRPG